MINTYVLDGDFDTIKVLCEYIFQTPNFNLMGFETDLTRGFNFLFKCKKDLDVLFLGSNVSINETEQISEISKANVQIVMLSSNPKQALQAYQGGYIDFLSKPISFPRFMKTSSRIEYFLKKDTSISHNDFIFLKVQEGKMTKRVKIVISDILRIEGLSNYIKIYTHSGQCLISYNSLTNFLKEICNANFVRCHRSHIVNLNFVHSLETNRLQMVDKTFIPITRDFKKKYI